MVKLMTSDYVLNYSYQQVDITIPNVLQKKSVVREFFCSKTFGGLFREIANNALSVHESV